MVTWIVRSDADRNKDDACSQDYHSSVSHFLYILLNTRHASGMEKECFVELCGWICGDSYTVPIVTLCIISGGRRLNGRTCRLRLQDRGIDVNKNANSHPCHIKLMLNTKPLAEGKELGIAEKLFPQDLRFSQRRYWRL